MTQCNQPSRVLTCTALVLLVIAVCLVGKNLGKPTNTHDQQPHHAATTPRRSARANPKPPLPASAPHPPAIQANDSSSTLSETTVVFLAGRAKLMRSHQQLMQSLCRATQEERQQAMAKWHEEHAEGLATQQHAIQMGAESKPPRMHFPRDPRIPANASVELYDLLSARHALMKGQAEITSQLHNYTPQERHRAIEKWHEENAPLVEAMHTAAFRHFESQPSPQVPVQSPRYSE